MKKVGGLLGIVIALGVGYFMFKSQVTQVTQGPAGVAPPKEIIDVVGVKNDLLVIGQAERTYMASHGSYASIEQLEQDGALQFTGSNRRGYNYSAEIAGEHFRVVATPADPAKVGWPTLAIDDLMQVTQQ
jgi:hypothetical protein